MRYTRMVAIAFASGLVLGASLSCSSGDGGTETPATPDNPAPSSPQPPGGGAGPPAPNDPLPSTLFVLGDSLSDGGNAAALSDYLLGETIRPPTVGLCSPTDVLVLMRPCDDLFYGRSRVSDGPVAVEHLAAHLGIAELEPSLHIIPSRPLTGTNYAVAGAKARTENEGDLTRQVDRLLLEHDLSLPHDALYVVMIGGNDAIDALQATFGDNPGTGEASTAIVSSAVVAIAENVERLVAFGARRLIVANVPDLATLPAVRVEASAGDDEAAMLAAAASISAAFDLELDIVLDGVEQRGQALPEPITLARFDLGATLRTAQNDIAAAGGNTTDACFDSDAYRQSSAAERVFHPDCAPAAGGAPRFDGFVFWDGIHPTGAAHAALGAALIELL